MWGVMWLLFFPALWVSGVEVGGAWQQSEVLFACELGRVGSEPPLGVHWGGVGPLQAGTHLGMPSWYDGAIPWASRGPLGDPAPLSTKGCLRTSGVAQCPPAPRGACRLGAGWRDALELRRSRCWGLGTSRSGGRGWAGAPVGGGGCGGGCRGWSSEEPTVLEVLLDDDVGDGVEDELDVLSISGTGHVRVDLLHIPPHVQLQELQLDVVASIIIGVGTYKQGRGSPAPHSPCIPLPSPHSSDLWLGAGDTWWVSDKGC